MVIRIIICILILGILMFYRSKKLKVIREEKKNKDSKVFSLLYDKLSNVLLIFFAFDMIVGVMARQVNSITSIIWRTLTIVFCLVLFVYVTEEGVKSTIIIRKNDFITFIKGERLISFNDIEKINIINTENKYVYLISILLNDGKKYEIKGKDLYDMNKVLILIKDRINKKV